MIILQNKNGVTIDDEIKFYKHHKALNAICKCGEDLIICPPAFKPDHEKGNPVMVCADHGVHSYLFNNLIIGKQND